MNRRLAIVVFLVAIPALCFMGPLFVRGHAPAFRDAGNFFDPLFRWQCSEWREGRIPLWLPWEGLGVPSAADATSSVFYPGKLLFALPFNFNARMNLYLTAHLLLAVGGMYSLARRWGASEVAAALSAITFAYSGHVLFQVHNVVFLVGCAWLPVVFSLATKTRSTRRYRDAVLTGASLAMMVLGGDPQMAYIVVFLLATLLIGLIVRERLRERHSEPLVRWFVRWPDLRLGFLVIAISVGLAGIQVFLTLSWIRNSERLAHAESRSIYDWMLLPKSESTDAELRNVFRTPQPETNHRQIYAFSIPPWRWPEMFWPNFSGRSFPVNQRWLSPSGPEDRLWTPSLFFGSIPFCLCVWFLFQPKSSLREQWLVWIAASGSVACMGWFGFGWLFQTIGLAKDGKDTWFGSPVGGLYWFLVTFLPGFSWFRYPAKLFVIVNLATSLAAGLSLDRITSQTRSFHRVTTTANCVSLIMGAVLLFGTEALIAPLSAGKTSLFGPVALFPGHVTACFSVCHALIAISVARFVVRSTGLTDFHRRVALVTIVVVELVVAQSWMIRDGALPESLPQLTMEGTTEAETDVKSSHDVSETAGDRPRLSRILWQGFSPQSWHTTQSANRLAEIVSFERATMNGKHALTQGSSILEPASTLAPNDLRVLLRIALKYSNVHDSSPVNSVWDELSIANVADKSRWRPDLNDNTNFVRRTYPGIVLSRSEVRPRVWVVNEATILEHLQYGDQKSVEERTRNVWFSNRHATGFRSRAVLETDDAELIERHLSRSSKHTETKPSEAAIANYLPSRVVIDVRANRSGLLILNDAFAPGWSAQVIANDGSSQDATIYRANRVMRAVMIDENTSQVVFSYTPRSLRFGAWVTMFSLIVAAGILVADARSR